MSSSCLEVRWLCRIELLFEHFHAKHDEAVIGSPGSHCREGNGILCPYMAFMNRTRLPCSL